MKTILSLCGLLLVMACSHRNDDNADTINHNCDEDTIISAQEYQNAPNELISISSATITGDCLELQFSASGCDGNNWEYKLIDQGVVMQSAPPQRNIRLSLKNNETCLAVIGKTVSFDLSVLQVQGSTVALNLQDFDQTITYNY